MASRSNVLQERFFTALISGDRTTVRNLIDEALESDCSGEQILADLFWPTTEHVQSLYRNDQLSDLCFHYATRLLRSMADQMQLRLEQKPRNHTRVVVTCGAEESEEMAGQITSDLLEAAGYTVHFMGGGVANDEVVEQLGEIQADKLVIFGAVASTVPQTRVLIDRLHDIGMCPNLQIIVGGGVFNRAEGLSEEIGSDLWANDPSEIVEVMQEEPNRRMTADQRTVGRKRRPSKRKAA